MADINLGRVDDHITSQIRERRNNTDKETDGKSQSKMESFDDGFSLTHELDLALENVLRAMV